MATGGQVIPLQAPTVASGFDAARARLTAFLIDYSLIASYAKFLAAGQDYPFTPADKVVPGLAGGGIERTHQNTALAFLIDGMLPSTLNKHFRLRASNKVTWRNIQRLAPDIDFSDYETSHSTLDAPESDALLRKLAPLDYALLIENTADDADSRDAFALTHLHVKIERLTDNAIKDLGRELGYIERRLFERGEDYVEALENKFFEYYGFAANASGRKSAAAMAAQLFKASGLGFTVFVASQEDNRLTLLDDSGRITQFMLIAPKAADVADLALEPYTLAATGNGDPVLLYRVIFAHTEAAERRAKRARDKDILKPWLRIEDEAIIGLSSPGLEPRVFPWSAD